MTGDGEAERLAAKAKLPYPIDRTESILCVVEYVTFIGGTLFGFYLHQPLLAMAFGLTFVLASATLYLRMKRRIGFTNLRLPLMAAGLAWRNMAIAIRILRGRSPWDIRPGTADRKA